MPEVYIPLLAVFSPQSSPNVEVEKILRQDFGWSATSLEHPDITWLNTADVNLSIEDVRRLSQLTATSPLGPVRYLIICNLQGASQPAQNALLKILEEPPTGNQFVLTTTSLEKVLPTVRSRCQIKKFSHEHIDESGAEGMYTQITTSSYAQLIDVAEKYGERADAQAFLNQLLSYVHSLPPTVQTVKHQQQILKTLEALDKNVNVRLALEDCFFQLKSS